MGVSTSINHEPQSEGAHFSKIINPSKASIPKKKSIDEQAHNSKPVPKFNELIKHEARIIKLIDNEKLWVNFLSGSTFSFAVSHAEATALLKSSLKDGIDQMVAIKLDDVISGYLNLISQLSEKDASPKTIDFMSILSASMFLNNDISLEDKIDKLFFWVTLEDHAEDFKFDQFFIAITSFERGLSHCMGERCCSETFVRNTASQWLALADPLHKGSADINTSISNKNFFDFCTNRQHVVRRLLETLSTSAVASSSSSSSSVQEIGIAFQASLSDASSHEDIDIYFNSATAGDEWLANPPWKKTAERMTPHDAKNINNKPSSNLTLHHVHGYRGFDCRNNLTYLTPSGSHIAFHAAGLVISQYNGLSFQSIESHERSQTFFGDHTDDITAFAVHKDISTAANIITIIASGEMGKNPAIHIVTWTLDNERTGSCHFSSNHIIKGFHNKGIAQLCFSQNGECLFSVGVEYSVAIYSTVTGKMISSAQGPKGAIFHCCHSGVNGDNFLSCGEKHAIFWDKSKGYKQEECKLGKFKNALVLSAVRVLGDQVILGTSEGDLLVNGVSHVGSHDKSCINALYASEKGDFVFSGGKDGKIMIWKVIPTTGQSATLTLQKLREFSVPSLSPSSVAVPIRSLCVSADGCRLLVGTVHCDIFELKNKSNFFDSSISATTSVKANDLISCDVILNSHFKGELWGLDVRPFVSESNSGSMQFCTVGDDAVLRIWDLIDKRQIYSMTLPCAARCCAYSPDGVYLAVGFGGGAGGEKSKGKSSKGGGSSAKSPNDGVVHVYRCSEASSTYGKAASLTLTLVSEIKEAKQWISVVKFSPDGLFLAVGSRDNSIYIYSTIQQFKSKAKFSKHNAGISQLDFSSCSKYIQSNCSAYEILFAEVNSGKQVTKQETLLNTQWASWTCSLGWPVVGVWSGGMDGSDINAVARSTSGNLLASADDFGNVKVFLYPAMKTGGNVCNTYSGHSSHVTNVKWASADTKSDEYLISCGGNDKCIFIWEVTGDEGGTKSSSKRESNDDTIKTTFGSDYSSGAFEGFGDGPTAGDEHGAVMPWKGAIVAPTAFANADPAKSAPFYAELGQLISQYNKKADGAPNPPEYYDALIRGTSNVFNKMSESGIVSSVAPETDDLELDWVYGYRGFDTRNNVVYVSSDERVLIVYFAAGLGVVFDPVSNTQMYFRGHTDDIMSIAIFHPSALGLNPIVATGQQAEADIFVWDPFTIKTLSSLRTKQKSVNMLCFSGDGKLLVSMAEDKTIAVSDWKSQTILVSTKDEGGITHHISSLQSVADFKFISCGDKYAKIWTLCGRNLTSKKILPPATAKAKEGINLLQAIYSTVSIGSTVLLGTEDGYIYVVKDEKVAFKFDVHDDRAKMLENSPAARKDGKKAKLPFCGVTAMYFNPIQKKLITGSQNGTVSIWNCAMFFDPANTKPAEVISSFKLESIEGLSVTAKQIQSVCFDINRDKTVISPAAAAEAAIVVLISTRGCDMLEIVCYPKASGKPAHLREKSFSGIITQGHCNDELWGCATHPTKPFFATVGDDKTLRFFSIQEKRMLKMLPLGCISRTCSYSHDGKYVALGFGGRVGKGKEVGGGMIRLYSAEVSTSASFEIVKIAERTDAKQWISDIKISTDDRTIVAGAHDTKIYIYEVGYADGKPSTLKLKFTYGKHNSVINHVDLSMDGRFMQSNCSAYELLFSDVTTGKQITKVSELKDVKWSSWTCTFGWPVQGIWTAGMDGGDINTVDRSHSGHLIATGDDLGKVSLFKYPCSIEHSQSLSHSGHSSHIMNVRWTVGDEYLISCGGNDKCIMQWRHNMTDSAFNSGGSSTSVSKFSSPTSVISSEPGVNEGDLNINDMEGIGLDDIDFAVPLAGDECGAVKPWLGAIKPPEHPPVINNSAPHLNLSLQWVYGYTSSSAGKNKVSSNLYYAADGNIVYPAAALGVKLGRNLRDSFPYVRGVSTALTQTYFSSHDDDILCLAISTSRRFVATGQTASKQSKGKASVCIWDASGESLRLLSKIENCHHRAVVCLAFSRDESQLITIGQDDNNTHIIWTDAGGNWSRVQKTAEEKGDKGDVTFLKWVHDKNKMVFTGEYQFISGGGDKVNFWKLQGSKLSKKAGRFGKYKQSALACAANIQISQDQYRVVVGTASGDLYVYEERETNNSIEKAHLGGVLTMAEGGSDCLFLVTGGKDGNIKVWNQALQPVSVFEISKQFSIANGSVASIDILPPFAGNGARGDCGLTILAGTYGGEIIEIGTVSSGKGGKSSSSSSSSTNQDLDISTSMGSVLLYSHSCGELWGLAVHPIDTDIVATVGDDATLRIWNIKTMCMVSHQDLQWPARCVAWHPSGKGLAVGFHEAVKGGVAKGGGGGGGKGRGKGNKGAKSVATLAPVPEESKSGHTGAVHLYSVSSAFKIKKLAAGCDSKAWIQEIKFTPDGKYIFVCSHDKKIYQYEIPSVDMADDMTFASCLSKTSNPPFNKHSSAVLHVDFTSDLKYFQTNCQAGELLFGTIDKLKQEPSATKLKDYNNAPDSSDGDDLIWCTQTCKLGWSVQGIFPAGSDLTDINSADRDANMKYIATADDFGAVNVFRYPCVKEGAGCVKGLGHSSHVTNVRWSGAGHLVSVGGNDKCLFVWSVAEA